MLNSFIPFTLANTFADLNVNPCPAWTSNPNLFPSLTALFILLSSLEIFLFLLIKLQIFPVCISIQSAFKFFAFLISLILGSI